MFNIVVEKYKDSGEVTVPYYVDWDWTRTGEQRPWFGYKEDEKQEMILQVKSCLLEQYLHADIQRNQ